MEWIKCSDRLPENEERVLCRLIDKEDLDSSGFIDISNYDGEDWWDIGLTIVTHWQPLPQLPKE